ncbi:pentatricopeptide repeat-containing protein At1g31920 isoform X2 [Amaranthus tricolor]|uniref:pentatricopeptide repeat-containing protein At1g31920 isoform X2 n=1 Tax=Amaranthus tricolor TaxID=29722 RepID=UPI00258CEA1F|nr:pentatricopeptide repeat-containing protein At1g31920 isoform X2 [Amaranthus tricolor]
MIRLPILHQSQIFLLQEDYPQILDTSVKCREKECISLLKKCKAMVGLKQVHGQMLKLGLFYDSFCVSNLLANCALSDWGNMDYASLIFSQIDDPGTFEFNTMIRGHTKDKDFEKALNLFVEMLERENSPDNFTYPTVFKACAGLGLINLGKQIHGQVYKLGFDDDLFVQNSLINMYGKRREIGDCCAVFERMEQKSVASWSALVAAHANLGMWWDCLEIFGAMMGEGSWRAEESILVSVICACTHLGALDLGKSLHGYLMRNLSGLNVIVETCLIDMYMKCGSIERGLSLFNKMKSKNQLSYSVMISGLAIHGNGHEALGLFSEMLKQGIEPDDVVYLGVLSACRHAGLVEKGLELFKRMRLEHLIQPTIQHYGCILDLLGRAAMFDKAISLIEEMPMAPNDVVWRSLLSAARVHSNLEVGEEVCRKLMQLGSDNAGDYIIMSNMYAQAEKWTDAANTRAKVADRGLDQTAGLSLVEVKRKVHKFVSQDKSSCNWEEIYEMIHQMEWQLKFEGYKPDTSEVLHNIDEEEKLERLRYHSQKLAIAYALLHTPETTTIRIVRNVRMCRDTHTYTKFISVIYNRLIVVRERNRFHHFKDGTCSCRDYW